MKKLMSAAALLAALTTPTLYADEDYDAMWRAHPLYLEAAVGWGSTDWSQLRVGVPKSSEDYDLLAASAPLSAGDKGIVYGVTVGYEISPHFAMEGSYMRFPNTTVTFDPDSFNAIEDGVITMNSSTYAYSFVGKFMVQVADLALRGFANAGAAVIHRNDLLLNTRHLVPTFGVGLSYTAYRQMMVELVFQYYAGYGKAVLKPANNYIPFLYTFHVKLGYRF